MTAIRRTILLTIVALLAALALAGCSDDDPTAPEPTGPGTVMIAPSPDHLAPTWLLTGPDDYGLAGAGADTVADLTAGDYTLTWDDLVAWTTPVPETATLAADGTVTFTGTYERRTAATPDEAMQFFETAYADRDLDVYSDLLDSEFLFIDQEGGVDGRDDEIAIAANLFHEVAGDNGIVIDRITIDRLEPQGVWQQTPANDPYFGDLTDSLYRAYLVDIRFWVQDYNLILRVQGPVLFYVLGADMDYRIVGIVDSTYGQKATESHTWTGVRALFD